MGKAQLIKLSSKKTSQLHAELAKVMGGGSYKVGEQFKTLLNEIYVVPYKIDEEVIPYTYVVPLDIRNKREEGQRRLRMHTPIKIAKFYNFPINQKGAGIGQSTGRGEAATPTHMCLSNINHFHQFSSEHQAKLQPPFTYNSPSSTQASRPRAMPRSEPKYNHLHEKNNRSNSIECKKKPIGIVSSREGRQSVENPELLMQSSKVSRTLRYVSDDNTPHPQMLHSNSIIFESSSISYCCGDSLETTANQINFAHRQQAMAAPEQVHYGAVNSERTNVTGWQRPSPLLSRINPIRLIKHMAVVEHLPAGGKRSRKGIRLSSQGRPFPKRQK